jgi:hypothetical protein
VSSRGNGTLAPVGNLAGLEATTSTGRVSTLHESTALRSGGCEKLRCGELSSAHRLPTVGPGSDWPQTHPLGLLHCVNDLAGYFGGTYVIGPVRQCLLDVRYLFSPLIIHRYV